MTFVREGSGCNGSFGHFTYTPTVDNGEARIKCHEAYLAWEETGGPLPLGSVRPSLHLAKKSLLMSISDHETEQKLRDRVAIWSKARKPKNNNDKEVHENVQDLHSVWRPKVGHAKAHKYTIRVNVGSGASDLVRVLPTATHTVAQVKHRRA